MRSCLAFCCDACYHSLNHASFYLCISSKNLEYIPKGNSSVILRNGDYYETKRGPCSHSSACILRMFCLRTRGPQRPNT